MGLDMYMYELRKPNLGDEVYVQNLEVRDDELCFFKKSSLSNTEYEEILPVCTEKELIGYDYKKEIFCVVWAETVWYGRKDYDIRDDVIAMLNSRGKLVNNTRMYKIPIDVIKELNKKHKLRIPEEDNIFYYEWY